jgi:predicted metalloenzyme YecM
MEDFHPSQQTMETPADYEAEIARYLSQMQHLNEKMRWDQAEIDRLKIETAALKVETQRLQSETRAILQRLGATV